MSTIYLTSEFGKLVKSGDTLQLKRENDILKTIFPFQTEQLVIIGNIDITAAALRFLMKHQIETVFLSKNGRFNGRIDFGSGKNVFLKKRQYDLLTDEKFILSHSKNIVSGKLRNQIAFVQRLHRKHHEKRIDENLTRLKELIEQIATCSSPDSLRGYEGFAARNFFSAYRFAIQNPDFSFPGRTLNPPRDPVNAVLSFLYTLIAFRLEAAIVSSGLDPYAGYFHKIAYGKKTLVFDLMEEYRTPLADTLTAALFNLNVLKKEDFVTETIEQIQETTPLESGEELPEASISLFPSAQGVFLTREALAKVISAFEKKLNDQIFYEREKRSLPYRQIFTEQVNHFKKVLTGEEVEYHPLQIR